MSEAGQSGGCGAISEHQLGCLRCPRPLPVIWTLNPASPALGRTAPSCHSPSTDDPTRRLPLAASWPGVAYGHHDRVLTEVRQVWEKSRLTFQPQPTHQGRTPSPGQAVFAAAGSRLACHDGSWVASLSQTWPLSPAALTVFHLEESLLSCSSSASSDNLAGAYKLVCEE